MDALTLQMQHLIEEGRYDAAFDLVEAVVRGAPAAAASCAALRALIQALRGACIGLSIAWRTDEEEKANAALSFACALAGEDVYGRPIQ